MKPVHVDALGLAGPGMASWQDSLAVLADESAYRAGESPRWSTSKLLPANERRRVPMSARLALQVAEEAMTQSSLDIDSVCSVFATCSIKSRYTNPANRYASPSIEGRKN